MTIEIVDFPINSMVDLSIVFCMFTRGSQAGKISHEYPIESVENPIKRVIFKDRVLLD